MKSVGNVIGFAATDVVSRETLRLVVSFGEVCLVGV
jgi:hypothetical protein